MGQDHGTALGRRRTAVGRRRTGRRARNGGLTMSQDHDTGLDVVTGAFSYSGAVISRALLEAGPAGPHPHRPSRAGGRPVRDRGAGAGLRRPGRPGGVAGRRHDAVQHLLGALRPRPGRPRPGGGQLPRPVPGGPPRRRGQDRPRFRPPPLGRLALPVLPGQGPGRKGPGRDGPSLCRPAAVGALRRARRAAQQHRLVAAAVARFRRGRRRRLPGTARSTSTTWPPWPWRRRRGRTTARSTPWARTAYVRRAGGADPGGRGQPRPHRPACRPRCCSACPGCSGPSSTTCSSRPTSTDPWPTAWPTRMRRPPAPSVCRNG